MNSFVRNIAWIVLGVSASVSVVQAQTLPNSTRDSGASSNPYNSPIRRANPNSRQGTEPNTPPTRAPNIAPPVRKPTLENGGIGNGYPTRQTPSRPVTPSTSPQRDN
ncbi:hypothetical protein [Pseudomonas syringae]|uniref:Lipoprotein n=2 Tax=Pseudomonas syringae group TaxID=136849 RepID=A0A9Q4A4L4_PSESX|nr:hypothetical protein [Pseudomonas syringae]KTB56817.1 hypothetical protein AO067_17085 [Pseudomonas viridiflava ICMP 13104]KTB86242.1 hypothetical protein AO070_08905 [Pseudomonas syringae pv. syringae PD2766]MCF5468324.1 hypothetical protein [Pseudomonas syringae]MCF5472898.1 hypothetical protein [Pseudomonas syringae]MCF5482913.1 hypothetical protein [Pseudomonas syringae]